MATASGHFLQYCVTFSNYMCALRGINIPYVFKVFGSSDEENNGLKLSFCRSTPGFSEANIGLYSVIQILKYCHIYPMSAGWICIRTRSERERYSLFIYS